MVDEAMLEALREEGGRWFAEVSFRGRRYPMVFQFDERGGPRPAAPSPVNLTVEGYEVGRLVGRARRGERLLLPLRIEPAADCPNWPSVRDPDWNAPSVNDVWLDRAERVGDGRWRAWLRCDGAESLYEVQFYPGSGSEDLQRPSARGFDAFRYDLTKLLLRMNDGERFALPFKLRPRWPTPPDPPALP